MAGQTLRIIVGCILLNWFMRVVACGAANSTIIRITFAVENSIRLKPYIVGLQASHLLKIVVGTMTSGAEVLG
jgi:hypothetical protein